MHKGNSQPNLFADTSGLSLWEKLEYRKNGVVEADMPVIMGLVDFKSVVKLFQEKMGRRSLAEIQNKVDVRMKREAEAGPPLPPVFEGYELIIDPSRKYNLSAESAHAMEPIIACHTSCELGFPTRMEHNIVQHPDFPFLLSEPCYMAVTPDPDTWEMCRSTVIQCHFTSHWKEDSVIEKPLYEHKIKAHMTMNIRGADNALIVYLCDNNDGSFYIHHLQRDHRFEATLIQLAKNFWLEHVEKEIFPIPLVPSDVARKEMADYNNSGMGYRPVQLFERGLPELVNQFTELHEQLVDKKEALKELAQQIDAVEMQMATYMFGQREAVCGDVKFKWTQRTTRSCNFDALKLADPVTYSKFVKESTKGNFSVTVRKKKVDTKEAA